MNNRLRSYVRACDKRWGRRNAFYTCRMDVQQAGYWRYRAGFFKGLRLRMAYLKTRDYVYWGVPF